MSNTYSLGETISRTMAQQGNEFMPAKKSMRVIRVEPDVHEALDEIGQRGETYGDIVKRLVKFYQEHKRT